MDQAGSTTSALRARNPGTMMMPGISQAHWSPIDRMPPGIEADVAASLSDLGIQLLVPATPAPGKDARLVAWVSTWMYAPSKETQADFGVTQSDCQPLSLSARSSDSVVPKGAEKVQLRGTTAFIVRGISQTTYGPPDWVSLAWKETGHPAITMEFDTTWMDEKTMRRWLEEWQWLPKG
jgi:hypothetical protein